MTDAIKIRSLRTIGDREIEGLGDVLMDCVEGGASDRKSTRLNSSH